MSKVVAEITVVPVGTGSTALSEYVAEAIRAVERAAEEGRVKYRVTPTATVVEGEADEVWRVLREVHEAAFSGGVRRVVTMIKVDDRRDVEHGMQRKLNALKERGIKLEGGEG